MILRDDAGQVVDSLNYGGDVDPWAAEGYQAASGSGRSGCYVIAPGSVNGLGSFSSAADASNTSAGRFPDGHDTDSNCTDFVTSPATALSAASAAGESNIKIASVEGFETGQTIRIDTGTNLETAIIAKVGTAGATTVSTAIRRGATTIPVSSVIGFRNGQTITIGSGAESETAVVTSMNRRAATLTVTAPLTHEHSAGAQVSGTGITLTAALTRPHSVKAQIAGSASTPGAPNHYYRSRQ